MFGDCASSTDDVVIYGINLGYENELKMQSRPEPVKIPPHKESYFLCIFGTYMVKNGFLFLSLKLLHFIQKTNNEYSFG